MKFLLSICCLLFVFTTTNAQFRTSEKPLTIIVTDGTDQGRNSEVAPRNDIPASYDQVTRKGGMVFTDPIRSLGMTDCIQAAAFLERPEYGLMGYLLIFSINDAIGGKQATLTMQDGRTYQGVYRLIRQKISAEEPTPAGMTNYLVKGTFFLLGMS